MDISQLCDRYKIASKKTLYRRLNAINLELNKKEGKVNASKEQIELLDQLDEHIAKGNPAHTFVPVSPSEVLGSSSGHNKTQSPEMSSSRHRRTQGISPRHNQSILAPEIIELIGYFLHKKDPFEAHSQLEIAVSNQWELSTSEVKNIIGCKPRVKKGDCYSRGSFLFYKVGKIGNESAWIVKKKC